MSKIKSPANWNWPSASKMYDYDPTYWGLPFYERAYMRIMYAGVLFVVTASFFDVAGGFPLWLQCVMGGLVAISALFFRWAYPAGFTQIWEWIMEGMSEAAKEMEEKGKKPALSSKEIDRQLSDHRESAKAASKAAATKKKD